MTEDGLSLVPFQPSKAKDPPLVMIRARPIGLSEMGEFTYGSHQCNTGSRPVGTRIDGGITGRVLYANGTVWTKRIRLRPVGDCYQAARLRLGGVAIGAAASTRGWVVAVEDSAGLTHLRGYSDFGWALWTLPLATVMGVNKQVKNVILGPTHLGVTVSLTESPFSWALVDSAGSVILQSSPFTGQRADTVLDRLELEKWKGYAVLPVKNGFIQTLESSRTQQGMFVLYDVVGRPVKVMRRFGTSVLVASVPEMRMLLGYRYNSPWGGSSKLFMYRY